MADSPPYPDTGDAAGAGPDHGSTAGTPRWVKVCAAIALLLILLLGVMLLTGGPGEHGPRRHTGSSDADGRKAPAGVAEGHRPPPGVRQHGARPR